WNCGVEGDTDDPEVLALRFRMIKNACAVLMCSRGMPMFLSGDEFGDTRFGNNNPYCQDNLISWLDWNLLHTNEDLLEFFRAWNCGVEGDTDDPEVLALRFRMIKNACAVLMCSRGMPMFLSGDEFGHTRFGNNNPYCQDNLISWLDWNLLHKNEDHFEFF